MSGAPPTDRFDSGVGETTSTDDDNDEESEESDGEDTSNLRRMIQERMSPSGARVDPGDGDTAPPGQRGPEQGTPTTSAEVPTRDAPREDPAPGGPDRGGADNVDTGDQGILNRIRETGSNTVERGRERLRETDVSIRENVVEPARNLGSRGGELAAPALRLGSGAAAMGTFGAPVADPETAEEQTSQAGEGLLGGVASAGNFAGITRDILRAGEVGGELAVAGGRDVTGAVTEGDLEADEARGVVEEDIAPVGEAIVESFKERPIGTGAMVAGGALTGAGAGRALSKARAPGFQARQVGRGDTDADLPDEISGTRPDRPRGRDPDDIMDFDPDRPMTRGRETAPSGRESFREALDQSAQRRQAATAANADTITLTSGVPEITGGVVGGAGVPEDPLAADPTPPPGVEITPPEQSATTEQDLGVGGAGVPEDPLAIDPTPPPGVEITPPEQGATTEQDLGIGTITPGDAVGLTDDIISGVTSGTRDVVGGGTASRGDQDEPAIVDPVGPGSVTEAAPAPPAPVAPVGTGGPRPPRTPEFDFGGGGDDDEEEPEMGFLFSRREASIPTLFESVFGDR